MYHRRQVKKSVKLKKVKVSKEALKAALELRCKPVVCDGVIYSSFTEASRKLNVTDATIRNRVLNNKFPSYQYYPGISK